MQLILLWVVIAIGLLALFFGRHVISYLLPGITASEPSKVMPIVVSVVVLACALYIIMSGGYPDAHQKWAFGTVGTVVGYWLKR